jgi:hypothetical protein
MNWDERGKDEDGLQRPLLRDSGIIVESQGKDDVTGASGGNDSLPHSPVHVICILALVALPFFEVNDDLFLSPNGVFFQQSFFCLLFYKHMQCSSLILVICIWEFRFETMSPCSFRSYVGY